DYAALIQKGDGLRDAITSTFASHGIKITTTGYGSVFSIWLGDVAPMTYEQAQKIANPDFSKQLHLALREYGVLLMPSPYGRLYISFDHSNIVIEEM
ncbi:hypothetical protein LRR18_17945, partial [Mangrovimonas sp. AS39]|uniref:hypothetical protein n=1 Tax=Mangrovimonas futianensis TaxID=2895523 RepID=UPI001E2D6D18